VGPVGTVVVGGGGGGGVVDGGGGGGGGVVEGGGGVVDDGGVVEEGGLEDVINVLGTGVLPEGEWDVELPSNAPIDERYASIPEAILVAAAESNGLAGTQFRSLVFPVVQGAICIVDD
jgi:hypothetical protein